jgi:photosystem II stability/assembly factor-like uncharacterized protein
VDPLGDDDSLLREHFAALRADTLERLRPAGALAARRSYAQRYRRRALVGVAAAIVVLSGAGGGYLLVGQPSTQDRDEPAAISSTAVPTSASGVNQATGAVRADSGPAPASSAATPPTPGPAGGPVPPGFRAESVTFISINSVWALGYAPCLTPEDWSECPAVVRSRDGGRTWVGVPAPGNAGYVGDIRFANPHDGWIVVHAPLVAKDPGGASGVLYATHDGGTNWHRVASVPAAARVEAAAGRVWVTTGTATGTAHAVYSAATGDDSFDKVADAPGTGLVVQGHYAYAYGGADLLSMKDGQVSRRRLPCATGDRSAAVLAASSEQSLAVVCAGAAAAGSAPSTPPQPASAQPTPTQPERVFTSRDGGATWTAATGTLDPDGYVAALAATTSAVFLTGPKMPVRVTRDSGASWSTALNAPTPDGFGYVGFTDDNHGVALVSGASPAIYLSSDAGRTWAAHQFD